MQLTRQRSRAVPGVLAAPRPRSWQTYVLVPALLLLVFVIDRHTEAAPIQHLYYVPIVLAAVWFGLRGSVVTSTTAVLLYHVANPVLLHGPYKHTDVVQIALFFAIGLAAAKVASDSRRLHRLAMTDDLTGLHNLRSFEARLEVMSASARGARIPLSMLVLDVDHLKSMNDTHGHLAGAEAVRAVGRLLAARLPQTACGCRYGGDEFVVALPGLSAAQATALADTIRRDVQLLAPVLAGTPFTPGTLSISVGVACMGPCGPGRAWPAGVADAGEALFRAADAALYRAKLSGRNCVAGPAATSAA